MLFNILTRIKTRPIYFVKFLPSVSVSAIGVTSVGVWTVGRVSTIGGVWGSVSVSSIPGFWFGISGSLADEVSSSIGGVWGSISIMSVGGNWGSIGTIGGSVWVSSISVSVSIGQPWLGFSIGVSRSLSQVTVSSSITVVSKTISTSIGTIGTSIWISSISVSTIPGIGFGFRFWLSEYDGDENGGNKEKLHVCFSCGCDWLSKVNGPM